LSEPTARSEALLETGLPGDVLPDQPPVDRGQPAPEPEPPEPVPAIAPELTDYSVTRGPPPRTPATAGSWRSTWLPVTALLLAGVAAGAWIARDRLPAPLAGLFDGIQRGAMPATPGGLLREHGIAIAVVLSFALFLLLRRYRAAWIAMAVALAVVLSGQLLHGYRAQIAAHYPVTRPVLERFCALLQCEVGLPKAAGQLVIEASDLQALDANQPNLIQLSATVRNRASIDVAFPAIEVTLTDAQDNPLARRVLLPEQYLARGPDSRTGLRAGEEFSVKLTLDTTELRPVGYRLYLFYP
jgi:hypothetical protein